MHYGASGIEFVLFDGGDDSEHNCVGFVEMPKIFAVQDSLFFGTISFWQFSWNVYEC